MCIRDSQFTDGRVRNPWHRRLHKETIGRREEFQFTSHTLKCELFSSYKIDFTRTAHGINTILGFTGLKPLEANILHVSDAPVNIIKVNTVRIRCNVVQGAYKNGLNEHTLHSFYPTVEPGFKIVETPNNVIYLPVNVQRLDNITLSVVDQDDDVVDFRNEVITIRIHLKKRSTIVGKTHQ